MFHTRRDFLHSTLAVTLGFRGLKTLLADDGATSRDNGIVDHLSSDDPNRVGFGPLVKDPKGILDLPKGFSYDVISRVGDNMDDGLRVPGQPDGMGAFSGKPGKTILIRNHEIIAGDTHKGAYGLNNELFERVASGLAYDSGSGRRPCLGGTSTLVVDNASGKVERQYMSLAGTQYNCAGGITPWNTWVTCEEDTQRADGTFEQDHGYPFEVPATGDGALTKAVPIKAMGRFRREAIAVDPATGIVYQTEDMRDGIFYRYVPNEPGRLLAGGKVQALCVRDRKSLDTRNWFDASRVTVGEAMAVRWIDMDDLDSPEDDLRHRGFAAGAAMFGRNEGIWWGRKCAFIASTEGGRSKTGQIWKYTPSPFEGTDREQDQPGTLTLFIEPNDRTVLENADNLTVSPWGDLVVCEDGPGVNRLVGVRPDGRLYHLASNAVDRSEFAGSVFSPDGSRLFVNMQSTGLTVAIHGPWRVRS